MSLDLLRYLFLDLNSFFASCEQQEDPTLRGKPMAVVPMLADTTCCLAASYEAKAYGIKTGTLVREARARCPEIRFVVANHEVYTRYHHSIRRAVEACIPIDTVMSIDEMICELMGSQRTVERAVSLAQEVRQRLRDDVGVCLSASFGLATNRFLAKLGSDMQKPNGLTVLLPKDLPQALHRLCLRDLVGIGPKMEERLNSQGVHTVEQLCSLSRENFRLVWGGIVGERYYDWLRGIDTDPIATRHGSLGHQHVLEPSIRTREGSWRVAKKLLVKASERLRREGYYARRLSLSIRYLDAAKWEVHRKVEETQDPLTLLSALKTLWSGYPSTGKPLCVSVTCMDLIPATQHQLSLLAPTKRENLGPAIDQLNSRYGKGTVSLGALCDTEGAAPRIAFSRIPDVSEF